MTTPTIDPRLAAKRKKFHVLIQRLEFADGGEAWFASSADAPGWRIASASRDHCAESCMESLRRWWNDPEAPLSVWYEYVPPLPGEPN